MANTEKYAGDIVIPESIIARDGKVALWAAYEISVYATADGHSASEKAQGNRVHTRNDSDENVRGFVYKQAIND